MTKDLTNARYGLISQLVGSSKHLLSSRFQAADLQVRMKDGNDPVTEIDLAVDKLVRQKIEECFPEDLILTEETSDGNFEALLDHPAVWIVDPLDGTKNFSRGIPNFATGIAFVSRGQPVLAGIAFADGSMDVITLPGMAGNMRIVAKTQDLTHAMIGMDLPKKAAARQRGADIAGKLWDAGVSGVRCMGSAVADAWRVAAGQLDAYIHTGLQPWDIAAPAAFIQAAGGRITRLDGSPWNVFCPDVLASNGHLHDDLLKLING